MLSLYLSVLLIFTLLLCPSFLLVLPCVCVSEGWDVCLGRVRVIVVAVLTWLQRSIDDQSKVCMYVRDGRVFRKNGFN